MYIQYTQIGFVLNVNTYRGILVFEKKISSQPLLPPPSTGFLVFKYHISKLGEWGILDKVAKTIY